MVELHSIKEFNAKMSKTFVQILLLSLLCKSGLGKSRVNKGNEIEIEDAPYMAYVQIRLTATKGLACDGSILSDSFILTAGHCKLIFFKFFCRKYLFLS